MDSSDLNISPDNNVDDADSETSSLIQSEDEDEEELFQNELLISRPQVFSITDIFSSNNPVQREIINLCDENTSQNTALNLNYDISLPIKHSYLGNLENIESARHLFNPRSLVRLKILYLNGIFLFPGQEIPLTFRVANMIACMENVIKSPSRTLGIKVGHRDDSYGTTAEIRSYSYKEHGILSVVVEGRQRFQIVDDNPGPIGYRESLVRILPEVDLHDYYKPLINIEKRIRRKHVWYLNSVPKFATDQYDNRFLMENLKSILSQIFQSRIKNGEFSFPLDAMSFSYFVAMSIPFPDAIKIRLLQMDCVNFRLRLEYLLLNMNFKFICSTCTASICDRSSLLVMSKLGSSGVFVNSHGIIHELYTVSKVSNIERYSEYDENFSWFPNYGWIIFNCRLCKTHLGWEFKTKNPDLSPQTFFALTKNAIHLEFRLNDQSRSDPGEIFQKDFASAIMTQINNLSNIERRD
ncbi:eukaryotic translation initiation factor 6 [Sarcoptes scabiei]|nr:eukaryotic translation initiation factor 6 [Sarcoptes scabiei]